MTLHCNAVFEKLVRRARTPEPPRAFPNPGGEEQHPLVTVQGFKDTVPPANAPVEDALSYIKLFKATYVTFAQGPDGHPLEPIGTTLGPGDANDLYHRAVQWRGMKLLTTGQSEILFDFVPFMNKIVRLAGQ